MRYERQNPDAKNFGLKSRDIAKAGLNALKEDMQSFSSVATMHSRWKVFCCWAKTEYGLKDLRDIKHSLVKEYASHLKERCADEELSPSTAQNYLSAVNRIMEIARGDREVSVNPVAEGGLPKRSGIALNNHGIPQHLHVSGKQTVSDRIAILLDLQRDFGLRFEESAKFNALQAYNQATRLHLVSINNGTKGGRPRELPIVDECQLATLKRASEIQNSKSMIPKELSYKEFKRQAYSEIENSGIKFHGERHFYAQSRYLNLVKVPCPVVCEIKHGRTHHEYISQRLNISVQEAKNIDVNARLQIAQELGHNRIDITNNYLG